MSDSARPDRADLDTSIDFVNTFGLSRGHNFDDFGTTRQAIDWLQERTGLNAALVVESPTVLDRVARARSAFRELWDASAEGRPAAESAVAEVNRVLRHQSVLQLEPNRDVVGHQLRLASRFTGDEVDCALAELAEPLVRAVGSADAERARICADDGCRWVFYDSSRTHQRRWCDMASCGNRAKAARHRARVRAGESASETSPNDA